MSSRRTAAALLAALLTQAACGFQPFYGERPQAAATEDGLARISVGIIADHAGQMLRNELSVRLDPNNRAPLALYHLTVELNESIALLALRSDASATRANLTFTASYQLIANDTGAIISTGSVRSVNSYDVLETEREFGTVTAHDKARRRAARDLADQIATRLGLALDQRPVAAR